MSRRNFTIYQLDYLYVENLIGQAINELRDMRDIHGNLIHKYHNLSKIRNHLDKYHNIQLNLSTSTSFIENRKIKESNKLVKTSYSIIANRYKKAKGNNYTFIPLEKKPMIMLKAISNLFRV